MKQNLNSIDVKHLLKVKEMIIEYQTKIKELVKERRITQSEKEECQIMEILKQQINLNIFKKQQAVQIVCVVQDEVCLNLKYYLKFEDLEKLHQIQQQNQAKFDSNMQLKTKKTDEKKLMNLKFDKLMHFKTNVRPIVS